MLQIVKLAVAITISVEDDVTIAVIIVEDELRDCELCLLVDSVQFGQFTLALLLGVSLRPNRESSMVGKHELSHTLDSWLWWRW
jgi:hypothetical protein